LVRGRVSCTCPGRLKHALLMNLVRGRVSCTCPGRLKHALLTDSLP